MQLRPTKTGKFYSRATLCLMAALMLLSMSVVLTVSGETLSSEVRLNNYRKRVGRAFIKEKAAQAGAVTLPSGLVFRRIARGSGKRAAAADDECEVHYTGKLRDGTVFDSSRERGRPISFRPSGVIKGWAEALQLMREGDRWLLFIPHELGYGEAGAGTSIPPFSPLEFDVELLRIKGGGTGRTAEEVDKILREVEGDRGDM
ncbi:macrophage infectivity potentiator, precursor [Trypanosoma rangeli]|uniref:peptidylprolyl isomerase n=1 Tax=Trypanosoma rangeli TaxID=5698 RepID=A0A3S5IR72_TRYRA|nr:macrophage infectivity potentiator, precursor [Trypanosoma rangeli]RNF04863.1 macrophage infectivity potentiator, precursor [Trypanosoma rangeli]|eukprot:RNF04863.1 macrophage infectivity potentiator, precursor [Trypanosoma rangeli]